MFTYVVTIHIQKDAETRWVAWMKEEHIPEVLKTGLFHDCRMCRSEAEQQPGCTTYRMFYALKSRAAFDTYEKDFAPALRQHASEAGFSGLFTAERDLLETLHTFSS